jgi:hypothetical protein
MRAILCVMMLFIPFFSLSQTPVELYQVEVPLDDTIPNARDNARAEGLAHVIVRASGVKASLKNDRIQQALTESDRYLSQVTTEQAGDKNSLKMQFNADQIKQLLVEAKLPYWPPSRKTILVWLVQDDGSQRSILWENSASELVTQFKTLSELRGLPVTIPIGDIDDVTAITSTDLWGGFLQPISQASMRYAADEILIVRIEPKAVNWTLFDQRPADLVASMHEPIRGALTGPVAIDQLVDAVTAESAKQQSIQRLDNSTLVVTLTINNIKNALDFFKLEQMLRQLTTVADLEVARIQGESAVYRTHVLASKSDFIRELLSTGMLVERAADNSDGQLAATTEPMSSGSIQSAEPNIDMDWQPPQP